MKKQLPTIFALCVVVATLLSISGYEVFSQRNVQVPEEEAAPDRIMWVILHDRSRFVVELDPMTEFRLTLESGERVFFCDAFSSIIFIDSGTVRVRFNNGEMLRGELNLERIPVTTNWGGRAEIERDLIQAIIADISSTRPRIDDEGHGHDHEDHDHDHGDEDHDDGDEDHDHEDHDHEHDHSHDH